MTRPRVAAGSPDRVAQRSITGVVRAQAVVVGITLLLMLATTVSNLVLRALATPYFGTFELVSLMAVVVAGLSLAETQRHHGHVAIDIVMSRAPKRVRLGMGVIMTAVATALFALVSWQLVRYGGNLRTHGAVTESLRIPYWPVALMLGGGFAGLVLALLSDLKTQLGRLTNREANVW